MTTMSAENRRKTGILSFACGALLLGATLAYADETPADLTGEWNGRMAAEQAELNSLNAEIAKTQRQADAIRVAGLFGESDEEKAARLQHEQNQDSNIATLEQRIGDLEESLRRLTGQIEQLDHRLSETNAHIAHMQKDFDYKLCSLAAQQLGTSGETPDAGGLSCGGTQQGGAQPGTLQQGGAPPGAAPPAGNGEQPPASDNTVHLGRPPGVLGTLPQGDVPPQPGNGGDQQQGAATRPQFDDAMNLLAKAQYDDARAAFRSFADSYPSDNLASQAVYWVGNIAFVQKDYANAARAFAEELKKYPDSPRAPQSMLKLGQSLLALNQKKEGCTALGALPSKYPAASQSVASQALAARKAAGCR